MTALHDRAAVKALYDGLRQVLAPQGSDRFTRMRAEILRYLFGRRRFTEGTDPLDWFDEWVRENGGVPSELRARVRAACRKSGSAAGGELRAFVERRREQYEVRRATWSFRDVFAAPPARCFDPRHLLADADITDYDAMHVLANYHLEGLDETCFRQLAGDLALPPLPRDGLALYCRLLALREPAERLRLRWMLDAELPRSDWEERYTHAVCAIRRLRLRADEALPSGVERMLAERYVVCLIVPASAGLAYLAFRNGCRRVGRTPSGLMVQFPDGSSHEYDLLPGTDALLVEAEKHWALQQRSPGQAPDAPMIL